MPALKSGIIALVVTAILAYGCYQLWLLLDMQIRGTPAADFKFISAIIASFLFLTIADYVLGWIKDVFSKRPD